MNDVPERLAEIFRDSYNTLHGTDYNFKLFGKNTFIDMELRLGKETKEEIEHTKADPEELQKHTNRLFSEISETLQNVIDSSGINEKFVLSVHTAQGNLTNNRDARILMVESLWTCLEKHIREMSLKGIKGHQFNYHELKGACGEIIADAFQVTVTFTDRVRKGTVLSPGTAFTTSENAVPALVLAAVERKADKASKSREVLECYPNPENLILLVELGIVSPIEPQDIPEIIEAIKKQPPVFKEVWIVSGSMSEAVLVWPS